jgi:hypothetical protein
MKLTTIAFALLLLPTVLFAEEPPPVEWFELDEAKPCARYAVQTLSNATSVLLINTVELLTLKKGTVAVNEKEINEKCNDLGKSLYGQLMKNPYVSLVTVRDKVIAIYKYPYPIETFLQPIEGTDESLANVLMFEIAKPILCK